MSLYSLGKHIRLMISITILFQANHVIKLYGTEEPIYIGETRTLSCTLWTNNNGAITVFSLGCNPCRRNEAALTLSSLNSGEIKWNPIRGDESYTSLVYHWKANEIISPLIICGVWWNGSQGAGSKEDKQHLNITGTYWNSGKIVYVKFTTYGRSHFSTIIQNFCFLYYIQGPPSQAARPHFRNKCYLVSITKPEEKVLYYHKEIVIFCKVAMKEGKTFVFYLHKIFYVVQFLLLSKSYQLKNSTL